MKAAADPRSRKRLAWLLVLLLIVGGLAVLSSWPSGTPASPSPAAPDRMRPGKPGVASLDPDAVPRLRTETERGAMEGEVVRNVFRFYDPPAPTPTRTLTPTITPILPGSPNFIGPRQLTPTPTPTLIVPPSIPYKALGLIGERGNPIVVLEEGTRIINARQGDVIDGRFKIERINRESVDFSFPPLPPEITKRLPLPVSAAP